MDKSKKHMEICERLNELYTRKNNDYGDSFANARIDVPNYTLGKLYDKFNRYMQLTTSGKPPQVVGETIEDTLVDMANYCIMELMEIELNGYSKEPVE